MTDELQGDGTWVLRGTASQNAVLRPVFDPAAESFIAFPWAQGIKALAKPIPITWADLNPPAGSAKESAAAAEIAHRRIKGRWMVAGVFWTDGRIMIDIRLESRPDVAREVLAAEIAHAVEYGMPFTTGIKAALMSLLDPSPDTHTWWEQRDYSGEYYALGGEAWMALFTYSYSRMVPGQDLFVHKATREMAPRVHAILGIDPVAPAAPPAPVDALPLTLLEETDSTLTLGWQPVPGALGYAFFTDGQRLSHTFNPARSTVRFRKGAGRYEVAALTPSPKGYYP